MTGPVQLLSTVAVNGQIQWRGVLLGSGTAYRLRSLTGWTDLPSHRVGLEPRAGRHGAHAGQLLAEHRTVTFEGVLTTPPTGFGAAVRELRRVTASSESPDEEPLIVSWDGRTHQVWARCVRRDIPTSYETYPFGVSEIAVQWVASDPRLLELPQRSVSAGLPEPTPTGLIYPLTYALVYGANQQVGGTVTLTNDGNADAWPIFRITGPAPGPTILDVVTGDRLVFDSGYTVPAGSTIEIDTNARSVVVAGTGVSRNAELIVREWFPIPPGESHLIRWSAGAYDPAARLAVTWHNTDL